MYSPAHRVSKVSVIYQMLVTCSCCTVSLLNRVRHRPTSSHGTGGLLIGWSTSLFSQDVTERGTFLLQFSHRLPLVCWLLFLSAQAAKLPEASLVPSEGLPQSSPETSEWAASNLHGLVNKNLWLRMCGGLTPEPCGVEGSGLTAGTW